MVKAALGKIVRNARRERRKVQAQTFAAMRGVERTRHPKFKRIVRLAGQPPAQSSLPREGLRHETRAISRASELINQYNRKLTEKLDAARRDGRTPDDHSSLWYEVFVEFNGRDKLDIFTHQTEGIKRLIVQGAIQLYINSLRGFEPSRDSICRDIVALKEVLASVLSNNKFHDFVIFTIEHKPVDKYRPLFEVLFDPQSFVGILHSFSHYSIEGLKEIKSQITYNKKVTREDLDKQPNYRLDQVDRVKKRILKQRMDECCKKMRERYSPSFEKYKGMLEKYLKLLLNICNINNDYAHLPLILPGVESEMHDKTVFMYLGAFIYNNYGNDKRALFIKHWGAGDPVLVRDLFTLVNSESNDNDIVTFYKSVFLPRLSKVFPVQSGGGEGRGLSYEGLICLDTLSGAIELVAADQINADANQLTALLCCCLSQDRLHHELLAVLFGKFKEVGATPEQYNQVREAVFSEYFYTAPPREQLVELYIDILFPNEFDYDLSTYFRDRLYDLVNRYVENPNKIGSFKKNYIIFDHHVYYESFFHLMQRLQHKYPCRPGGGRDIDHFKFWIRTWHVLVPFMLQSWGNTSGSEEGMQLIREMILPRVTESEGANVMVITSQGNIARNLIFFLENIIEANMRNMNVNLFRLFGATALALLESLLTDSVDVQRYVPVFLGLLLPDNKNVLWGQLELSITVPGATFPPMMLRYFAQWYNARLVDGAESARKLGDGFSDSLIENQQKIGMALHAVAASQEYAEVNSPDNRNNPKSTWIDRLAQRVSDASPAALKLGKDIRQSGLMLLAAILRGNDQKINEKYVELEGLIEQKQASRRSSKETKSWKNIYRGICDAGTSQFHTVEEKPSAPKRPVAVVVGRDSAAAGASADDAPQPPANPADYRGASAPPAHAEVPPVATRVLVPMPDEERLAADVMDEAQALRTQAEVKVDDHVKAEGCEDDETGLETKVVQPVAPHGLADDVEAVRKMMADAPEAPIAGHHAALHGGAGVKDVPARPDTAQAEQALRETLALAEKRRAPEAA